MTNELITSPSNALLKRARALRSRKGRLQEDATLVEGVHPVLQALEHGAAIDAVIVAPDLLTAQSALAEVDKLETAGTTVARVGNRAFASISQRDNPIGLAAIVRVPHFELESIQVAGDSLFVALLDVGNPGNLGTIARTMDAVAATALFVIGDSTDPFDPAAVKASLGTVFSRPVLTLNTAEDLLAWARSKGVRVIATSAHATQDHRQTDYSRPLVLLLGNEARGLPGAIIEAADGAVGIAMRGSVTSLNLAVAAGILLYEAARYRESS